MVNISDKINNIQNFKERRKMISVILLYSFFLLMSLLLLWFSGDLTIRYSVEFANRFHLTNLFIGFALIAVVTGLPELSISIVSIFKEVEGISAGTILGSNVSDISLILGLPVFLYGTIYLKTEENKNSLYMLFISGVAMIFVFVVGVLTKTISVVLILIYFYSIWFLWRRRTRKEVAEEKKHLKGMEAEHNNFFSSKIGIFVKLFFSIILVVVSSEFAVRFSIKLTELFSFSLETIGATILAVGTSLPELSVSLSAVKKKEYDLAIGNSLGSVLEQGTLLLGFLGLGSYHSIDLTKLRMLAPFMFASFAIIGFGMLKRKKINKIEGGLLLMVFILFVIYQMFFIR